MIDLGEYYNQPGKQAGATPDCPLFISSLFCLAVYSEKTFRNYRTSEHCSYQKSDNFEQQGEAQYD
jgi:hypothetical protein